MLVIQAPTPHFEVHDCWEPVWCHLVPPSIVSVVVVSVTVVVVTVTWGKKNAGKMRLPYHRIRCNTWHACVKRSRMQICTLYIDVYIVPNFQNPKSWLRLPGDRDLPGYEEFWWMMFGAWITPKYWRWRYSRWGCHPVIPPSNPPNFKYHPA